MSDFKAFIEENRVWYQSIGNVFCPILNEWVVFNAKGFYHLRYNGLGKMRSHIEQKKRMKVLPHVMKIIQEATSIVKYQKRYVNSVKKEVEYWELGGTVGDYHVTVILRKIGQGSIVFYSTWKKKLKKPSMGPLV